MRYLVEHREGGMALAREKAAQLWCDPRVSTRQMDTELAEVVAEAIHEASSQPYLGLATTGELLDEIRSRVNTEYRTVGEIEERNDEVPLRDVPVLTL